MDSNADSRPQPKQVGSPTRPASMHAKGAFRENSEPLERTGSNHEDRFTLAICTVVMAGTLCRAAELYVAPDGNDTNPGTRAAPLKTLEAARDALRKLKSEQPPLAGGATVWLRGGVYRITKTFELDERDSGTQDAPIVYRACENEQVCLSGGRELDPAAFRPVTDPAVLQRWPEVSRARCFRWT